MNEVEDGVIKYAIDFERYKNGRANEIVRLFDAANAEIAKYIKRTTDVATKKQYNKIAKTLRRVAKRLKSDVADNTDIDGLIEYEIRKQRHLLGIFNGVLKKRKGYKHVDFTYPTIEQVRTAALFRPVTDGFTYDSYLNGIESGLFSAWDSAVRGGYLAGIPTDEIVKNVMGGVSPKSRLKNPGLINSLRNSVYGNTRTLLQSFANETRNRVYKENEKYFGDGEYKYEYLATLDSRTCVVCGVEDGKLFRSLKDSPSLPRHRGCRCVIVPWFGDDGGTRSSRDGYVDSKVTFEEWLKVQDERTQLDVLGRTRYELFRRGEPMSQFVDNGKVLTIEQLNTRFVDS